METKNYLSEIQSKLKAPKGQRNNFGNYNYRSCEDILEALKPIINKDGYSIVLVDEMVEIGSRVYVCATATLSNGTTSYQSKAYAREEETKKGMDASQITGAASSYARKYALNGLFAIDDTKDSDATNTHGKDNNSPTVDELPELPAERFEKLLQLISSQQTVEAGRYRIKQATDKFKLTPEQLAECEKQLSTIKIH